MYKCMSILLNKLHILSLTLIVESVAEKCLQIQQAKSENCGPLLSGSFFLAAIIMVLYHLSYICVKWDFLFIF